MTPSDSRDSATSPPSSFTGFFAGPAAGWIAATLLALAVFGFVQAASPHAVGVDGLFHIKAAELVRENLPTPWIARFDWLEHTALRHDRFADFHWGFHILLLPFTLLPLETAAKVAPVVFSTASVLVLYFLLGSLEVRARFVWYAIALLASPIFLMRLSQNKAPVVMVGVLLLFSCAMLRRRDLALGLLGLVAAWIYPVLPLIAGIAAALAAARWVCERRIPWRAALSILAGLASGLVVHPDFPRNLRFLIVNLSESVGIEAGEYAPLTTRVAATDCGLLALLYLVAFRAAPFGREAPRREAVWGYFFSSTLLGLLTARYMRGIDYLPPFVALFAAVCLDEPLVRGYRSLRERLGPSLRPALPLLLVLLLGVFAAVQSERARAVVARNSPAAPRRLEAAANWLADNSPPGEMVLNLSSGDFEQLWLYNTRNRYFIGVNLNFLRLESPDLFDDYVRVTQLGDMDALRRLMSERPGAACLLASDRLPRPLVSEIATSPLFETVYRDRSCMIARLRP